MKIGIFLHHLGLGDHIICNSITRKYAAEYDLIYYPVKSHNIFNVKRMFLDLNNIEYIEVADDSDMIKYYEKNSSIFQAISLGFFVEPNFINQSETFCKDFYRQACLQYNLRWDNFYINRNYSLEDSLFSDINYEYIFVHDDKTRNFVINKKYLNKEIYRPKHNLGLKTTFTIFDYLKIIENSQEIHCMDSSFAALIDHMPQLKNKTKFLHRYVRKATLNPFYKNNWTIIDE